MDDAGADRLISRPGGRGEDPSVTVDWDAGAGAAECYDPEMSRGGKPSVNVCPTCRRRYTGSEQKFCIDDATPLVDLDSMATMEPAGDVVRADAMATQPPASPDSLAGTSPIADRHRHLVTDVAYPPQVDPLAEGAQVGEYRVGQKIGEGGMGMIYSGVHPIIGKKIALKVLNQEMASNPDVVQRFILEAKAVNQIGHRNIVDIFSFGKLSDGRHYFAMEFLEGQSLSARLANEIPVPWSDAIQIWIQVASAIEAAHSHGIVHRDLKPDNVYVTPHADGPFVKVLDFGIAKLLGDVPAGVSKTAAGLPVGTPAYMSPEQARGGTIDHRTDIYALGIILYETIAGRPPFLHHKSLVELLTAHLTEQPPLIGGFVDVHPGLDALVVKMLQKEPGDRPNDMRAVREELLRLRDLAVKEQAPLYTPRGDMARILTDVQRERSLDIQRAMTDTLAPGMLALSLPPPPAATKRGGVIAGAALLALGAVGAVAWSLGRHPQPAEQPQAAIVAPPAIAPPPATGAAASGRPTPPGTGRVFILTNAVATRVFLDKSATEPSSEPAAAGGMNLTVNAPADVNWVVRVEADGFKPASMPLKIAAGQEISLPVSLVPIAVPPKAHRPTVGAARPATPAAPGDKKAAGTNAEIVNPFDQ